MAERLSGSQVQRIIDSNNNNQFLTNQEYYEGRNVTILDKDYDGRPDNRIPLPFARRTINDVTGYAYKFGNVTYQFSEDSPDKSIEKIEEIFKFNDEPLVSGEIFQDALIKGQGAELQWVSDGTPQFTQIPMEQCIFVYKDSVRDQLDYSIRYYTSETIDTHGDVTEKNHADVYHTDRIDFYESSPQKKMNQRNPQEPAQQATDDDFKSYKWVKEEKHFYGDVPLYPYRINSDWLGVFQPALSIIDTLDEFGSDSIANAIDRFNETIMVFSKKLDDDTAAKIKDFNIFDDLGDKKEGHFVDFLNREMDITSTVDGFELFERLYYELTGIPNIHSEKFQTKSGIAMLYALIPFENLVATFEMYFSKGLIHRVDLLNNLCQELYNLAPVEVSTKWVRNLPTNVLEIIMNIKELKIAGIVSDETLLRMLPPDIIPDVDDEIKKVEKQKAANIELFGLNEPKEEELEEDE